MAPSKSLADLGPILLIGGEGFLGSFIINFILHDPSLTQTSITVAGLKPVRPQFLPETIVYYTLDITNESGIREILATTRARLVFHLASPLPDAPWTTFEKCNIRGTEILLRCAKEIPNAEALIYTSSNQVLVNEDRSTPLTEEAAQLWTSLNKKDPYGSSKAIADTMVRHANGPKLRTVVLRFPNVYGGTDAYTTVVMDFLRLGIHRIQLGQTSGLNEFVAAENVAFAHVLAAKAVLSTNPAKQNSVAGEAFFISDDEPDTWYGFARKIWAEAGHPVTDDQVWKLPFWILFLFAWVTELFAYLGLFGGKGIEEIKFNPGNINRMKKGQHRLNIDKARNILGYERITGREEGLKKTVKRNIEAHEQKKTQAKQGESKRE